MNGWLTIVQQLGLPASVLLYMLWRAGTWLGTKCILPVVRSHRRMIRQIVKTQASIAASFERLAESADRP